MNKLNFTKTNLLNNFFSRTTLRHCLDGENDNTYNYIIKNYIDEFNEKTNVCLISKIYEFMKDNYRNEYIYKNTLLNSLLIEKHNIETTTAFTELPIANSKADFLLINGKAVVYEIKTELDNLERLENQIKDYYKAFDHVTVVSYKNNVSAIEKLIKKLEKPIGLYILDEDSHIITIREPNEYKEELDIEVIFKILRKKEYEELLLEHYKELPKVSDFKYYKECKRLFCKISLDEIYPKLLKILKLRKNVITEDFLTVPYELKFLSYFMNLKKKDYTKMKSFLIEKKGGF